MALPDNPEQVTEMLRASTFPSVNWEMTVSTLQICGEQSISSSVWHTRGTNYRFTFFLLSYILQGSNQRAEFLTKTLSILLILYENKYLDMEILERTIYFYAKKKNPQKKKNKEFV